MTDSIRVTWPSCGKCKSGRIVLFTSSAVCADCMGTGLDLSDERLKVGLNEFETMLRTRRFMHRYQLTSLCELFCFVQHQSPDDVAADSIVVEDVEQILLSSHLPIGYWRSSR
jgi:hypothetical protein